MKQIKNTHYEGERPLFASHGLYLEEVTIHAGESALKECSDIEAVNCRFEGKYPFWHNDGFVVKNCLFTEGARAALWYYFILDIFGDGFTGLFAHHIAKIVSGKEYFISEVLDRWQPLILWGISFEIFVEQMFEADNDVFVYSVSCVELAFVKAHTIVEQ